MSSLPSARSRADGAIFEKGTATLERLQRRITDLSAQIADLQEEVGNLEAHAANELDMRPHLREAALHLEKCGDLVRQVKRHPLSPHPQRLKRSLGHLQDAEIQAGLASDAVAQARLHKPGEGSSFGL